eukprot:9014812-Lingulodinium_polyedra.AAC.1
MEQDTVLVVASGMETLANLLVDLLGFGLVLGLIPPEDNQSHHGNQTSRLTSACASMPLGKMSPRRLRVTLPS